MNAHNANTSWDTSPSDQDLAHSVGQVHMASKYWLPPHVFLCCLQNGVVFLDIRQDKYFSLPSDEVRLVSPLVENWPLPENAGVLPDFSCLDDANQAASELERKGLITTQPVTLSLPQLAPVQQKGLMIDLCDDTDSVVHLHFHHCRNFLSAYSSVAWMLRFGSLENAIQRLSARKRASQRSAPQFDQRLAADLTNAFRRLRLYFFAAHNRCLFHALALTEYLGRYQIFPTFIIGVKVTPWGAHAWVQHENLIFDMSPERTLPYSPILAI
jgi:Transglutaminase-like superfamily